MVEVWSLCGRCVAALCSQQLHKNDQKVGQSKASRLFDHFKSLVCDHNATTKRPHSNRTSTTYFWPTFCPCHIVASWSSFCCWLSTLVDDISLLTKSETFGKWKSEYKLSLLFFRFSNTRYHMLIIGSKCSA